MLLLIFILIHVAACALGAGIGSLACWEEFGRRNGWYAFSVGFATGAMILVFAGVLGYISPLRKSTDGGWGGLGLLNYSYILGCILWGIGIVASICGSTLYTVGVWYRGKAKRD